MAERPQAGELGRASALHGRGRETGEGVRLERWAKISRLWLMVGMTLFLLTEGTTERFPLAPKLGSG